jgi:hypothetical protein
MIAHDNTPPPRGTDTFPVAPPVPTEAPPAALAASMVPPPNVGATIFTCPVCYHDFADEASLLGHLDDGKCWWDPKWGYRHALAGVRR